jgi:hypothetical protein
MKFSRILIGLATSAAVLLSACGGGGGGIGGTGGGGGGGGIGGTGVAYGGITGFGSVWVNGVRYDTSSATFKRDDSTVSQSDLRVGMVARIEGSSSASTATLVSVDSALKGRVEQVGSDTYTVMGQTVRTDASTAFEDNLRPALGDYVEVHGLPVQPGVVAAGYIERKSALADPPYKVTGFVATQDAGASTLTVGTLTVSYASAKTSDMGSGSWVGRLVEIKGAACAASPVCGTLTASVIEPAGPGITTSPQAEIEGYVSTLTADGFTMGGQTVVLSASTVFEDGLRADLAVGVKVEVEGPITNGVLTATKVQFRDGARAEADVLAIVGDRITLAGLPGVEIQVTSATELKDLASLGQLQPGQHIRVRGRPTAGNVIVASELEARDAKEDVELRGAVSAVAAPSFTLLGLMVDTSGLSDNAFRDNDVVIGRASFFSTLTVGRAVSVKGVRSGDAVVWEEVELED